MRASPARSILAVAGAAIAVGGCGRGARDARPPDARPGYLVVERVGSGRTRLVDAPAQATYCAGDSVLVIIAVDRSWGAGLALRTQFPVPAPRALRLGPALEGDGTGTAALRAVTDSVQRALVASAGTVRLGAGPRASGTFDVRAPAVGAGRALDRLLGAFQDLPTTETAARCGSAARTP